MRLALALLGVAGLAQAQPVSGLYVGAGLGLDVAETVTSRSGNTRFDNAPGGAGLANVGWGFGQGLREELEGSFRGNSLNGIAVRRVSGAVMPSPAEGWGWHRGGDG